MSREQVHRIRQTEPVQLHYSLLQENARYSTPSALPHRSLKTRLLAEWTLGQRS